MAVNVCGWTRGSVTASIFAGIGGSEERSCRSQRLLLYSREVVESDAADRFTLLSGMRLTTDVRSPDMTPLVQA